MAFGNDMTARLVIKADAAGAEAALRRVSGSMGMLEARMKVARGATNAFNDRWRETINVAHQVGRGMQVMGAAILGASAMAVRAYMVQEEAENRLTTIVGAHSRALIENAAAIQKRTRYADEDLISATAVGATYMGLRDSLGEAQEAAVNMSEAYKMDLIQAMHLLGKASVGQVGMLRRYGIMVDIAKVKTEGMSAVYEQITKETKNAAFATDNVSKSFDQLKNRLGDIAEKAGPLILKVLDKLTPTVERLVSWLERAVDTPLGKWAIGAAPMIGVLSIAVGTMLTKVSAAVYAWNLLTAAQLRNVPAARAAGAANAAAGSAAGAGAGVGVGGGLIGRAGGAMAGGGMSSVFVYGISAAVGVALGAAMASGIAAERESQRNRPGGEAEYGFMHSLREDLRGVLRGFGLLPPDKVRTGEERDPYANAPGNAADMPVRRVAAPRLTLDMLEKMAAGDEPRQRTDPYAVYRRGVAGLEVQARLEEGMGTAAGGQAYMRHTRGQQDWATSEGQEKAAEAMYTAQARVRDAQRQAREDATKRTKDREQAAQLLREEYRQRLGTQYGAVAAESQGWADAWGGAKTVMGRRMLVRAGQARGAQQRLQGQTEREQIVRHIIELSSDGDTASLLLQNRGFADALMAMIRGELARVGVAQ